MIRDNPKIFLGYSDTTVNHFMCYKAGLSSFYGGALLVDFAENGAMDDYTVRWIKKALFSGEVLGEIPQAASWTSERLPWIIENRGTARNYRPNGGYQLLQGKGAATGHLLGGCVEVMEWLKGTELFPPLEDFDGAILFLETSEEMPPTDYLRWWMRSYGAMGILSRIHGIVLGKPYGEKYAEDYKAETSKVLGEYGRDELPVLCDMSFGHCEPKMCIPYGALAEIDCERRTFSILESGVL